MAYLCLIVQADLFGLQIGLLVQFFTRTSFKNVDLVTIPKNLKVFRVNVAVCQLRGRFYC